MLNADVGHVFVAYDHDDTERVVRLRDALVAAGLPIWWDQSIGHGDVIDAIEAAIRQSACVMPVWTAKSVKSRWVRDELRVAEEAGRSVCAVRLEAVSPPVGLGQSRAYDLFPLRGQKTPHFRDLVRTLSATIRAFASEAEPAIHLKSRKILQLPCFVRSVSSHETFLRPDVALRALQVMKTDAALVSAYDIAADSSDRVLRESNRLTRTGTILFLDSGNYEASRKSDSAWSARRFEKTIRHSRADLIFCFDNVHADSDQRILLRDTVTAYRRLTDLTDTTAIPVLHLPRSRAGRIKVESAPILAQEIMAETGARILAIPERELGDGLFARARQVWALRKALDSTSRPRRSLHLLGTGNPLSLAVFTAAGADSFDGLEWCRTAVDEETMFLFHPQQFDFFQYQAARSSEPVVRASADDPALNYNFRIALHNLDVLTNWVDRVRKEASARTLDRFLAQVLPAGAFEQLASQIPEIFSRV